MFYSYIDALTFWDVEWQFPAFETVSPGACAHNSGFDWC